MNRNAGETWREAAARHLERARQAKNQCFGKACEPGEWEHLSAMRQVRRCRWCRKYLVIAAIPEVP